MENCARGVLPLPTRRISVSEVIGQAKLIVPLGTDCADGQERGEDALHLDAADLKFIRSICQWDGAAAASECVYQQRDERERER